VALPIFYTILAILPIMLALAFYSTIGFGRTIQEAFDQGKIAL